ncbi:helix-turn-helix domain-containing protein [Ferruginibacter albus]|uniref:helix-turn-helix domain-containing protein n=1 Tax=Ferruginibacter albus TaxID=2875540 RepID=UPI001CC50596|nr:AraC family transcriptional regulator [Ferruginibacter albus]UAY53327.1 AraC family transcriptional regulator [Ferruginibacter albus]
MTLFIRNMACDCCKVLVEEELEKLGVHPQKIELGEVHLKEDELPVKKQKQFTEAIKRAGLEIVENKKGILLEKIKQLIHEYVNNSKEKNSMNLSTYLSKALHYDYAYLTNFFSEMEATTIEQYVIALKIEKVKELILFDELTLTEIAYKLHYSSVAHLSNQFKKVTGLTPSHFRKLKEKREDVKVA